VLSPETQDRRHPPLGEQRRGAVLN